MAHWSENAVPLSIVEEFSSSIILPDNVHFFDARNNSLAYSLTYARELSKIAGAEGVICFLADTQLAASMIDNLSGNLKFQLWVAIKTYKTPVSLFGSSHTSLIIMTKYTTPLQHTKTRIEYTYCPSCEKTTKDYGGKKHTYNSFGTLMSDVWKDFDQSSTTIVDYVLNKMKDLFGLQPHLYIYHHHTIDEKTISNQPVMVIQNHDISELDIESGSLVNGDCISELQKLPSNSVDFCFADPPYNIKKKYDSWNDGMEINDYFIWCDEWINELVRVLKPGRTLAILNIPLWAVRHFSYLASRSDVVFQRWIVWEGLSLPVRMIMPSHYSILCFTKGPARQLPGITPSDMDVISLQALSEDYCLRAGCVKKRNQFRVIDRENISDVWSDIHRLKHNSKRVDHPCQLPPELMRRLYALFTYENEVILDPFNGSGTSTLVAAQMGRRYLGIELSLEYHQLAHSRHLEIQNFEDPFGKRNVSPISKNSRVKRLEKRRYEISKRDLQIEVKRISTLLGRIPSRDDVVKHTRYSIEFFDDYFLSWAEVTAAARTTGMSESKNKLKIERNQPVLFK